MIMVVEDDSRYAIDIRALVAMLSLVMSLSFLGGAATAPWHAGLNENPSASNVSLEDLHHPSGQHLLVDILHVDSDFLNSEERLSNAIVQTVQASNLTMLSYHCHSLVPAGVSCVGVLLESHISFHTWPAEGVITLDLFTCGSNPLLPLVPVIERLFGIPNGNEDEKVRTKWSHELRGFRDHEHDDNHLADSSDLSLWILSFSDVHSKTQIYSGVTNQSRRVDIWDLVELVDTPSHDDVVKFGLQPEDPRLFTAELTTPDRLLFLDGSIQSIASSDHVYQEAMVHPTMLSHPSPKHVAILGAPEGATLREVLKHTTVESVVMLEPDQELVEICREYMPSFSDCSDLVDRAADCFEDKLVSIEYTDSRQWFLDRFGSGLNTVQDANIRQFDVIVMDNVEPEDDPGTLYSDKSFISSLIRSLSDDGVLVIQVGAAATIDDPKADHGMYQNREALFVLLEENPAVEAMLLYEEPQCGFLEPQSFLLVCKSSTCRSRWYAGSDVVDYEIYRRIVRTRSKQRALTHYDGTTHHSYLWPKKGWETVYCRREPTPWECAYRTMDQKARVFELDLQNEAVSAFSVDTTTITGTDPISRVFAKQDIPRGSFIMPNDLARSLQVTSPSMQGLAKTAKLVGKSRVHEELLEFFEEFAHQNRATNGSGHSFVEVGATVLIRRVTEESQPNLERWVPYHRERPKYSPVFERHRVSFDILMVASRDIAAGEEILMPQSMWDVRSTV